MREVVTEEDALDVIEIMKESLFETFEDEYGFVDFRRATGMSKGKQATTFIAALTRVAERDCNNIFSIQELQKVTEQHSSALSPLSIWTFDNDNNQLKRWRKTSTSKYRISMTS